MTDAAAPLVVSIGTTHPWNIAGVGQDLLVGAELQTRVLTAVAAVSAQDAGGIRALEAVSPDVFHAQLEAVPWRDARAVRVGALPSIEAVEEVERALRRLPHVLAVVDPVFGATRGGRFGDNATVDFMRDRLATLQNVVLTPNVDEAAELLGTPVTRGTMVQAAIALQERGAHAVLLKGGHLEGPPEDVLASGLGVMTFREERLPHGMRGTGCVLAMALACRIAAGAPLIEAVAAARGFTREKIANAKVFHGLRVAY